MLAALLARKDERQGIESRAHGCKQHGNIAAGRNRDAGPEVVILLPISDLLIWLGVRKHSKDPEGKTPSCGHPLTVLSELREPTSIRHRVGKHLWRETRTFPRVMPVRCERFLGTMRHAAERGGSF
jgi:hypothetical protein